MDTVPFDDRDGFMWYNGEMVPWREAKVHVLNHGLHYASSVFEGLRIYDGKIFKLTEHSKRLHQSAELIGFKIPYSVEELNAGTKEAASIQKVENGYILGKELVKSSSSWSKKHDSTNML